MLSSLRIMNWDYVAGFFDGEGSVSIRSNRSSQLRLVNTDKAVMEAIRDFVGFGTIYCAKARGNCKSYYQLSFCNRLVSSKLLES